MSRASREEATRTRVRIVEKASELLRERGVDQVSIADVMSALGLTTGGFYKHFESKEALVAEAMALSFERASASWQMVAGESDGVPAQRVRLVQHYLRAKPAHQRCPMIAFAPHVAKAEAGAASREGYQKGLEELLDRFGVEVPSSSSASSGGGDALVLFAAMIGAQVLSQAAGDSKWTRDLCVAVEDAARKR